MSIPAWAVQLAETAAGGEPAPEPRRVANQLRGFHKSEKKVRFVSHPS
jgi:hypothetical protein